jgi:hypothetical protein
MTLENALSYNTERSCLFCMMNMARELTSLKPALKQDIGALAELACI